MNDLTFSTYPKLKGMEHLYKVTLIDDDPISHLINTRILERFATFSVEAFTDPVEALFQLKTRAKASGIDFPDFILLDIDMPRLDGWQFLEEFQKLPDHVREKTQVIMLSSSNHVADVEKSRTYSVVKDFITKPLTMERVQMIILPRN